jgi:hypothetical protein
MHFMKIAHDDTDWIQLEQNTFAFKSDGLRVQNTTKIKPFKFLTFSL